MHGNPSGPMDYSVHRLNYPETIRTVSGFSIIFTKETAFVTVGESPPPTFRKNGFRKDDYIVDCPDLKATIIPKSRFPHR